MLTALHVKNLALIDEAEVSFGPGLNILTGETGAGKSVLLGSVNLALGQKMPRDMIRSGASYALAELVFTVERPSVLEKLEALEVIPEDGQIVLTRKIQENRSIFRINGETCTAAKARQVSALLLDIHGQHEHQSLLYADRQLEILDAFGAEEIRPLLAETAACWERHSRIRKALSGYQQSESERQRETDLLEYEIREIENAALTPGEEETLDQAWRKMSGSRKVLEALQGVHELTAGDGGASDLVGRAIREITAVAGEDAQLAAIASQLTDLDSLLQDLGHDTLSALDDYTFSEEDLYNTEHRLDEIRRLQTKYGRRVEDILAYLEKQQARLDEMRHYDAKKAALEKDLAQAGKALSDAAGRLTEARRRAAKELEKAVSRGLADLNFLSTDFRIAFTQTETCAKNGADAVSFLISANPGEPLRPLSGVASGGELSRIMLAVKTLLADRDDTPTLIFDEIDTGISGRTAQKVSEKMARIAASHQVICITHLSQIAAMADTHLEITKTAENGTTVTRIRTLGEEDSVRELARILGGAEVTDAVYQNAREMRALAEERKKALRGPAAPAAEA